MNYKKKIKKISLKHLNYLTDDFGVWQHTNGYEIDRKHGYSLDDVARALLVAVEISDLEKIKTYTRFLDRAIGKKIVTNFFSSKRKPLPRPWSEDALGEAFWALAVCHEKGYEKVRTVSIMKKAIDHIGKMKSIRGKSYALLGAIRYDDILASKLASSLYLELKENSTGRWFWIEDSLRYGNAIIPLALMEAGKALNVKKMLEVGLKMLDFLNRETKYDGLPIAIGNKGWYEKGGEKALYDQQPIDLAYQVLANIEAFKITGKPRYLKESKAYFGWFWGNNILNSQMIDIEYESCYDGLTKNGPKKNMGSENIVCYLLAQGAIWPFID